MQSKNSTTIDQKSYRIQKAQFIVSTIIGVILIAGTIALLISPQITIKGKVLPSIVNILLAAVLIILFIIYIIKLPEICDARLNKCDSMLKDLQINMGNQVAKELNRLWNQSFVVEEFSAIMKNLRPFFDQDVNYSFYKILNLDHHREPKEKFRLLNNRFNSLYERYGEHLVYNLSTNYKDLRDIIIEAEQMFNYFRAGQRHASGFKVDEYTQLRMDYNFTIARLNHFLKARHEKLGIEFRHTFKPLPD